MNRKHKVRGQATMEYVLVFAVILAALIAAIGNGAMKTGIDTLFSKLGSWLSSAANSIPLDANQTPNQSQVPNNTSGPAASTNGTTNVNTTNTSSGNGVTF